MEIFLYTVLILLSLFIIVSLLPVRLHMRYIRQENDDNFQLDVGIWPGLLKYSFKIQSLNLTGNILNPFVKFKARLEKSSGAPVARDKGRVPLSVTDAYRNIVKWYDTYMEMQPVLKYLMRHTRAREFNWQTRLGLSDPAWTGAITGWLWSLKGTMLSFLYSLLRPGYKRPCFNVVPDFSKPGVAVFLDCIFEVRMGHIMITGLRAGRIIIGTGIIKEIINKKYKR